MITGFIYEWTDLKTGLKYVGRHEGNPTDGYIASGTVFLRKYNDRPSDFVRSIIWISNQTTPEELQLKEEEFLNIITEDELYYGNTPKYYNVVKNAAGYTSSENPMKNSKIVEQMKATRIRKNLKSPWENSVEKYGLEEATRRQARSSEVAGQAGRGNKGKIKTEEHKRKIAESVKARHEAGSYYTNKPGRKKKTVDK